MIKYRFSLKQAYADKRLSYLGYRWSLAIALTHVAWLAADNQFAYQIIIISLGVIGYSYLLIETFKAFYLIRQISNRRYSAKLDIKAETQILQSALSNEQQELESGQIIESGANWKIYDALFDIRDDDNGKKTRYTIFEAKLRRDVPNIVFDSKKAKGYQFRSIYLKAQKLSFDDHLDDIFEIYAPKYYQTDILSIITPDVIVAMIQSGDYDIELIADSLFCYGPLLSQAQVIKLKNYGLNLYKQLDDNLDSYRDNRLEGQARLTQVTDFGRRLLKDPNRYFMMGIVSAVGVFGSLVLLILLPEEAETGASFLFISISLLVLNLRRGISILKTNKQQTESMTTAHGTILGNQPNKHP